MTMRLVLDAADRHAVDAFDCPQRFCSAKAGTACQRSGGAVAGGSRQRFGEYVHTERYELARDDLGERQ